MMTGLSLFLLLFSPQGSPTRTVKQSVIQKDTATPIDSEGWPGRFPAKEHCSKCGLCETKFVSRVTDACAFLNEGMARIDKLEEKVHGRNRDLSSMVWSDDSRNTHPGAEEGRFGVLHKPLKLARGKGVKDAQWTGCVSGIALSMLESGMVDAVVCIAKSSQDQWSSPEPILARTREDVLRGRGVKPALAPSLRVLDEIQQDKSVRRLLLCGVGCAVQAFRSIQDSLGLDEIYVLGTNCADNSPTPEAAEAFIRDGVKLADDQIRGYEFMQDFRVHVKTDNAYVTKPYFTLPGSIAEASIAPSCLACFDYTNALADVVVGYMGAPLDPSGRMDASSQTLTIRNERGNRMVQCALDASRIEIIGNATGSEAHEKLATATVASDAIVLGMTGGNVPEKGMPRWLGEVLATAMTIVGPKGVNFARYSIDYHILRNYLHVLDAWGEERAETGLPQYARIIVERYLATDSGFRQARDKIMQKR